jgi:uncharacterized protein involved in exopolysaccharide biosynthesis
VERDRLSNNNEGPAAAPIRRRDIAGEITSHLWHRKWFIIKVMACAIVVFGVVLFLVPNKFKAQATLLIAPPRFTNEVRSEPLSVETARNLVSTGEMMQQIIVLMRSAKTEIDTYVSRYGPASKAIPTLAAMQPEQVQAALKITDAAMAGYVAVLTETELTALHDLKRSQIDDWSFEEMSKLLETEDIVEKKTATDIKISPLLNLYAVSDTGPKAQLIANTWAYLAAQKYDEVTNRKTSLQYDSIKKQQATSQKELQSIQQQIVDYKTTNNLELYLKQIDEYSEDFREYTNQYVLKSHSILVERRKLMELMNILRQIEAAGEWIGRVTPVEAGDYRTTATRRGASEADIAATETTAPEFSRTEYVVPLLEEGGIRLDLYGKLREKALQSRFRLLNAMTDAQDFYRNNRIELMEKERDALQKNYLEAMSKLRNGQIRLEVLTASVRSIEEQLSNTQPFIILRKEVPDVNIAEAMASGRREDMKVLSGTRFEREELNPAYSSLEADKIKLQGELEMTRNEVAELQKQLPGMDAELNTFQDKLYRARLSEKLIEENLARDQRSNSQLYQNYVETNQAIYTSSRQLSLLQEEVAQVEKSRDTAKQLAEDFQEKYNRSAAELQLMEARQRAVQRNGDLLLQKLQEAQLAVTQDVSDVSIAATAVTPVRHFFPKRKLFLAVLTLLTAAVLLGGMGRSKYMEIGNA